MHIESRKKPVDLYGLHIRISSIYEVTLKWWWCKAIIIDAERKSRMNIVSRDDDSLCAKPKSKTNAKRFSKCLFSWAECEAKRFFPSLSGLFMCKQQSVEENSTQWARRAKLSVPTWAGELSNYTPANCFVLQFGKRDKFLLPRTTHRRLKSRPTLDEHIIYATLDVCRRRRLRDRWKVKAQKKKRACREISQLIQSSHSPRGL